MNRYPEYKDSGIEWIGEIPSHWVVSKIKYLSRGNKNSFTDGDWIESPYIVDEGIRYITTGNIGEGKFKNQGSSHITEDTFNELSCSEVFPGDLVISRLSPPVGRSCLIPDLGKRIITSVDNVIIRPKDVFDKVYYNFLFNSKLSYENTQTLSRGATLIRISRTMLGDIETLIPSLDEQTLISKYLDKKTSQIDSLIEKTQQKVELLKEQRTALISQCVTKGLDANVKLKDSGVEWIGEIPSHWKKVRLKSVFVTHFGGSWGTEPEEEQTDHLVQVIRVMEFDYDTLTVTSDIPTIRSLKLDTGSQKFVVKGDLILEKSGGGEKTPVGRLAIVDRDLDFPTVNSNFTNLIKIDQRQVVPKFVTYMFNTLYTGGVTKRNIKQTTGIQNLDLQRLFMETVYIPDYKEMEQISTYLDHKTQKINSLMEKTQQKVELLKEYRQSLISNVVTGKIRVTEGLA